jgi:excisionase family DNA binding protein
LPYLATLAPTATPPISMEEYMTGPEVAELLKLSEKTVYRLARKKDLPRFKAGGSCADKRIRAQAGTMGMISAAGDGEV